MLGGSTTKDGRLTKVEEYLLELQKFEGEGRCIELNPSFYIFFRIVPLKEEEDLCHRVLENRLYTP